MDVKVKVCHDLIDLLGQQLVELDLVQVQSIVRLLLLNHRDASLHGSETIDVPIGLPQVFVVASLYLVTQLHMLSLNELSHDLKVSSQLLKVKLLLLDKEPFHTNEVLDSRIQLLKLLGHLMSQFALLSQSCLENLV